jgi:transcription elongation factor GreA
MTPSGYKQLQEELRTLKSVERPKVIKDIETARAHGDLSENAEYDAAKERQAFIEARIRDIEGKVARARIVDRPNTDTGVVAFGATVTVQDADADARQTWTIVGDDEANIKEKKLSISAPLARALIGKRVGDAFELETPRGTKHWEVTDIRYGDAA